MAARKTFDHHKVIQILGQVGRSFCSYLRSTIIAHPMQQRINNAADDAKALLYIREVC